MNTACNCLSLRQATRRVTQLYDQALAPLDLRATQRALLSAIERRGPIALNPLAEAMVLDRATLGHNVRPLEARGLVRLAVGKDRRSREVSITRAGRATIAGGAQILAPGPAGVRGRAGCGHVGHVAVRAAALLPPRNFRSAEPRSDLLKAELAAFSWERARFPREEPTGSTA